MISTSYFTLIFDVYPTVGVPPPKPSPKPSDERHLDQLLKGKLTKEIQMLKHELKEKQRKLIHVEKHLASAQELKAEANKNAIEVMAKLKQLDEKMQKITEEMSFVRMKLDCKEQECKQLSETNAKNENHKQFLQNGIIKKQGKIKLLKEEVQKIRDELKSAQEKVKTQQEKMSKAELKLENINKEVMQLLMEKSKLACSCNIGKERVSKFIQITLTSDKTESMKVNYGTSQLHTTIQVIHTSCQNWKLYRKE